MTHEWQLTADQKEQRINSTRTYKKVFKMALANGLSLEKASSAAHSASRAALNDKVPGWERGQEGFAGLFV